MSVDLTPGRHGLEFIVHEHIVELYIPTAFPDMEGPQTREGRDLFRPWLEEAMKVMGSLFGGATAIEAYLGIFRSDKRFENVAGVSHPKLLWDSAPWIIHSCVRVDDFTLANRDAIKEFMVTQGKLYRQEAVALKFDNRFIRIPLEISPEDSPDDGDDIRDLT